MDIAYIPVRVKNLTIREEVIRRFLHKHPPEHKEILLTATAQFQSYLDQLIPLFQSLNLTPIIRAGRHTRLPGQVLGCDAPIQYEGKARRPASAVRTVFFLGDGVFHVKELLQQDAERVYAYQPFSRRMTLYTPELIKRDEQHRMAGLKAFHAAERVGVIISLKPGQQYYRFLNQLRKAYPGKKYYPIVFDTIDFSQLENFPFVQAFVNTACPRLMDDYDKFPKPVVNIRDLLEDVDVQ